MLAGTLRSGWCDFHRRLWSCAAWELNATQHGHQNMLGRLWRAAAARLPSGLRFELRRANFSRQIHRGSFRSPEPEALEITRHLRAGDWAIDVGANVGHYTCQMAGCVGASGRVLAFEPIGLSFALLTANVRAAGLLNVTLFNIALSSRASLSRMTVPSYEHTRLDNYYRAHIAPDGEYPVLCLPLDAIPIPGSVRLVKIDAEGHDLQVLLGMESLLQRDRPRLIVEGSSGGTVASWLTERGYAVRAAAGSSNIVATPLP
jgi:FkbM family methyltransferase